MGADRKANTWESWFERRGAYLSDCRVELPLRPSAIAAPPSGPSWLRARLRGWGSVVGSEPCQWALTQKQTLRGGGAPKRGHGAPLERLAQLGYALGGVGAVTIIIEAAELVVIQAAKGRRSVRQWALTQKRTLLGGGALKVGTEDVASQTASRGVWLVVRSVNGR